MELLTVQETAALHKVSEGTVRRHVTAGRLPALHVGRLTRIRRELVERFPEPVTPKSWKPTSDDDPLWNIVGIVTGDGPADFARNHDHYLAEAFADLHEEDDIEVQHDLNTAQLGNASM